MSQELNEILKQRNARYGSLAAVGQVAQDMEDYLRKHPHWERLAADQKESLSMIVHKIGRIMAGDPNYDDNWVDIAGYATCVTNRLQADQAVNIEIDLPSHHRGKNG